MIPGVGHFIWYGSTFPWVHGLAIRSALERGGFERVILHHDGRCEVSLRELGLLDHPAFECRPIETGDLFRRSAGRLDGPRLQALHDTLDAPNARANMVRAAVLAAEGGVYLDCDTVTVASLTPLREQAPAFCGHEHIVFPAELVGSRNPGRWVRAAALHGYRDLCRRVGFGVQAFRRLERHYPRAVNNAVLGAEPGHGLPCGLLQAMLALSSVRRGRRYALGTHLLQTEVPRHRDVHIHPPSVFYPLPPEISLHWFRMRSGSGVSRLDQVLYPETRVVHWYASVRTRSLIPQIGPAYVRQHADRQWFSALALPFVSPRA